MVDLKSLQYPFQARSWTLESESVAIKRADKTLIEASTTGVPQSIKSFFLSKELTTGERKNIKIIFQNNLYSIQIGLKEGNRHILNLINIKDELKLGRLTKTSSTVRFEKAPELEDTYYIDVFNLPRSDSDSSSSYNPVRSIPALTVQEGTVKQRRGQDFFKQQVSQIHNNKCFMTKVMDQTPSILIASHIKAWVESTDEEKLDGYNGILLSPHLDKLFDNHLISFESDGRLLISNRLSSEVIKAWSIDTNLKYVFPEKSLQYLAYHRKLFFKKNSQPKSNGEVIDR